MLKKRSLVFMLWLALIGGFLLGMGLLFQWRFQAGDIYPAYSSFRSDPLGTKVLFESLGRLHGVETQRHLRPWDQLPDGGDSTLFILGVPPGEADEINTEPVTEFMRQGGRVVVAFRPVQGEPRRGAFTWKDEENEFSPRRKDASNVDRLIWRAAWDFTWAYEALPGTVDRSRSGTARLAESFSDFPEEISLHTALFFAQAGSPWTVLYEREGARPVCMERPVGHGSLVVLAESFLLSNEAMRAERYPALLSWLAGDRATVLFAERQLGVSEEPGIAALVRKYRLHGFLVSVTFLAGLFIWKNAASLVPAEDVEEENSLVAGKESSAGFLNLLQRGIAPGALLGVCFEAWKKSLPHDPLGKHKLGPAEALFRQEHETTASRNPVETYRKLSRIIAARKSP
jgi:hypothetical protein